MFRENRTALTLDQSNNLKHVMMITLIKISEAVPGEIKQRRYKIYLLKIAM